MYKSVTKRDTKIPQNNDNKIPIICVVAKPNTGPRPNTNKIAAVKKVVTCASITGAKERL